MTRLADERRQRDSAPQHFSVVQALINPRVLALALVYFGAVACNYGLGFFLPTIVKGFGADNVADRLRDRDALRGRHRGHDLVGPPFGRARKERKGHAAIALVVAAAGIGVSHPAAGPAAEDGRADGRGLRHLRAACR